MTFNLQTHICPKDPSLHKKESSNSHTHMSPISLLLKNPTSISLRISHVPLVQGILRIHAHLLISPRETSRQFFSMSLYVTTDHTPLYCKVPTIIPKNQRRMKKFFKPLVIDLKILMAQSNHCSNAFLD